MQNRRVLVLGASGRIGGVLRKFWDFEQVLWQTRARSGPGWVGFDPLAQPKALAQAASGCSAILCLAGVVTGRLGRGGDLSDNIALGEAAVRAGAVSGASSPPLVFLASSAAVYGNQPGLLEEGAPLRPTNAYGRSKADMEARAGTLAASLGVQVCALRIGNIAGLDAILGGWKPGFQLDRFADGRTPRRSYIGVATLARVLGDLMGAKDLPQVLNIACPGTVEMGALLDAGDLAWTPRVAPKEVIKEVCLSTRALARITPLEQTGAASLVAEWNRLKDLA